VKHGGWQGHAKIGSAILVMLCVRRVAENLIIQDVIVLLFLACITWMVAPQLIVVMSTTARQGVEACANGAHVAWGESSEVGGCEERAVHERSTGDQ